MPVPPKTATAAAAASTIKRISIAKISALNATNRKAATALKYLTESSAAKIRLNKDANVATVDIKVSQKAPENGLVAGANAFVRCIPPLRYNNPEIRFTYSRTEWFSELEKKQRAAAKLLAEEKARLAAVEEAERIASGAADETETGEAKSGDAAASSTSTKSKQPKQAAEADGGKPATPKSETEHSRADAEKEAKIPVSKWKGPEVQDPTPFMTVTFADGSSTIADLSFQTEEKILLDLQAIAKVGRGQGVLPAPPRTTVSSEDARV